MGLFMAVVNKQVQIRLGGFKISPFLPLSSDSPSGWTQPNSFLLLIE